MGETMQRSAVFSPDGRYRYRLDRSWGPGKRALWCCLNPSTAGAEVDDPSVRKMIGFTKRWCMPKTVPGDFGSLVVVNMWGRKGTDWRVLLEPDPSGEDNWMHIREALIESHFVIAAWGAHAPHVPGFRAYKDNVMNNLLCTGLPVWCLGTSVTGQPRHPLMLPYSAELRPYALPHHPKDPTE